MKSIRRAVGFAAIVIELGLLSGCGMAPKAEAPSSGGAAAPAPATEAAPTSAQTKSQEQEPLTLADAEALLEKARADLDRLALNEPGAPPAAAGAAAPAPAPAKAPALSPPRDEARRADKSTASAEADSERPQAKEANACETACKAFSSLARASDAVCRLDTDGGKRCERARQIRADASHRVASCGCAQ